MPYTTAETLVVLDLTTTILPASNTRPDLSRTAFAGIEVSNSIYSLLVGVPVLANATRTVTAVAFLFTMFSVNTENVLAGTVYRAVSVVAARSATPNLPVAMFYFSNYLNKK